MSACASENILEIRCFHFICHFKTYFERELDLGALVVFNVLVDLPKYFLFFHI